MVVRAATTFVREAGVGARSLPPAFIGKASAPASRPRTLADLPLDARPSRGHHRLRWGGGGAQWWAWYAAMRSAVRAGAVRNGDTRGAGRDRRASSGSPRACAPGSL